MRRALVFSFALCLLVCGCSRVQPPAGRWEGAYDGPDSMVAVRLEIDKRGAIYLSAPDALNLPPLSDSQRAGMHARLAQSLAAAWGQASPRQYEFDGRVFRKPSGIAPQMEWSPAAREMAAIVYLERRPGLRIPLRPVSDFSADPWTAAP